MRLPTSALSRAQFTQIALSATLLLPLSTPAAEQQPGVLSRTSSPTGAYQPALQGKDYGKSEMSYEDFPVTSSGLRYKDAKLGKGAMPVAGDRVVVEWTGYTIGYFGRPFETKKLKELDGLADEYLRFKVGEGTMIPALEEGVLGMTEGGVRQLVVPPSVGYPASDPGHVKVGPKPSTFSGQRALDFVLGNKELIDKTLLFNVKLIRVDKPGQTTQVPDRFK